jgi:hypothetical protein
MKLRTLVISVVLLAGLAVAAYLKNRPEPPPPADARVGLPLLDPDTVSRAAGLTVSDQGKKVDLRKGADGVWTVASYYDMPADFEKISRLAQDLNEAKVERFVTDNPDRLSHLEFKDSRIALEDATGKEIWSVTLGKTPDTGNGRFIRFGDETKAYFSGVHVWLDTEAKGWADAQIVGLKPEDIAKVGIPFADGSSLVVSRPKKDAPWVASSPTQKVVAEKINSLVNALTGLRFSETVDPKAAAATDAAPFMKAYTLTTFDGRTLSIAMGRKPEVKKLKAPTADAAALIPPADGKTEVKPITPEFDTTPAGPVFVSISSSDAHAAVNALMKKRAFQVDDYTFTALPQKASDVVEADKPK